jgi:hypothetical protein
MWSMKVAEDNRRSHRGSQSAVASPFIAPYVCVKPTGQILQSIADIASESTTGPHYVPGRDDR